jgi:uncharacterized protein YdeI (YjbR/CyaY-like superfamily)
MPIRVDASKIREFETLGEFYEWLGKHHDKEPEVWIKVHKVGSGLSSINPKEAIDAALCWVCAKHSTPRAFFSGTHREGKRASGVKSTSRMLPG